MLESPILYLKRLRTKMFQLSDIYSIKSASIKEPCQQSIRLILGWVFGLWAFRPEGFGLRLFGALGL